MSKDWQLIPAVLSYDGHQMKQPHEWVRSLWAPCGDGAWQGRIYPWKQMDRRKKEEASMLGKPCWVSPYGRMNYRCLARLNVRMQDIISERLFLFWLQTKLKCRAHFIKRQTHWCSRVSSVLKTWKGFILKLLKVQSTNDFLYSHKKHSEVCKKDTKTTYQMWKWEMMLLKNISSF